MDIVRVIAVISLVGAGGCAVAVIWDLAHGHAQRMWIMNVVWPLTMLWGGPVGLWAYFRIGRQGTHGPSSRPSFPVLAAKATTHCGSGCTLGDLIAESLSAVVTFSLFGDRMFGTWAVDYVMALLIGVAFQYFTIAPMRHLSPARGLLAAAKADVLSLTAWQVGMYGWMAVVRFAFFGRDLPKDGVTFWFMMQIAMAFGFATSYPMNWWLLRRGIKEAM